MSFQTMSGPLQPILLCTHSEQLQNMYFDLCDMQFADAVSPDLDSFFSSGKTRRIAKTRIGKSGSNDD